MRMRGCQTLNPVAPVRLSDLSGSGSSADTCIRSASRCHSGQPLNLAREMYWYSLSDNALCRAFRVPDELCPRAEFPVAVDEILALRGDPVEGVSIVPTRCMSLYVHKGREEGSNAADMDQFAEQAILAQDTLGLTEQTWYHGGSSNGVQIWHDVRRSEVLNTSQQTD